MPLIACDENICNPDDQIAVRESRLPEVTSVFIVKSRCQDVIGTAAIVENVAIATAIPNVTARLALSAGRVSRTMLRPATVTTAPMREPVSRHVITPMPI